MSLMEAFLTGVSSAVIALAVDKICKKCHKKTPEPIIKLIRY